MQKKSLLLTSLVFLYSYCAAFASDLLQEQEILSHQLSQNQINVLNATVASNRKQHLNQSFSEGQLMVNLMTPDSLDVKIIKSDKGEFETRYVVPNGSKYTVQQTMFGLTVSYESTHGERPQRLDRKGYAKENADGSITLGRIYHHDLKQHQSKPFQSEPYLTAEFAPLSRELRTDLTGMQKQRLPEDLRDKNFKPRNNKVPHKPTAEDLEKIAREQRESREKQLAKLRDQFAQLPVNLLEETDEITTKLKEINKGFELLVKNLENENYFQMFIVNVEEKISQLKSMTDQARRAQHFQQTEPDSLPLATTTDLRAEVKEIKALAKELIAIEEEKAESHANRPNAVPLVIEIEQNIEEKEEKEGHAYIFIQGCQHDIINALEQTSNNDTSYTGINISRERLRNFVAFLRDQEKEQRINAGETLNDQDKLGYDYREDQGKGCHTKVKLGRGTKPIIMSSEGGIMLSVNQLRDLKEALIQKGLILQ